MGKPQTYGFRASAVPEEYMRISATTKIDKSPIHPGCLHILEHDSHFQTSRCHKQNELDESASLTYMTLSPQSVLGDRGERENVALVSLLFVQYDYVPTDRVGLNHALLSNCNMMI
jgi:hypothetical protein